MSPIKPNPGLLDIEPYKGGKALTDSGRAAIKLSSNESALGPSPQAVAAFRDVVASLKRYPDGAATALRTAIAGHYGLNADHIICGNGSDEIIQLLCQAYLGPGDEMLYSEHGFSLYAIAARAAGATPVAAPEKNRITDVDALLAQVTPATRIVFIANPNNPTGTYLPQNELQRLRAGLRDDILLVLDAAYAEFVRRNDYAAGIELVAGNDNVVMTRTFSKIYALAGLRLGWAYCPKAIVDVLNRIRGPFNINIAAQAAGIAALQDRAFTEAAVDHNEKWLAWLEAELRQLGLRTEPSVGNFLLISFPETAGKSAQAADAFLQQQGLILRRMESYGFANALRLTVGTETENKAVIAALQLFMQDGNDAAK
ncbi:MAG TPA: histidinol-phosphate transaminase [Alphaproteobacteria bacterium]|nr:histidinol-phosphate transaminase [Alphaproteobacteria bacterium]